MQKWEYVFMPVWIDDKASFFDREDTDRLDPGLGRFLGEWGNDGWEITHIVPATYEGTTVGYIYYLRRPKAETDESS